MTFNSHRLFVAVLMLFFSAQTLADAEPLPESPGIATSLKALIASQKNGLLLNPDISKQAEQLGQLYQLAGYRLLWLGEPRTQAAIDTALSILDKADQDGLNPADYATSLLRQNLQIAMTLPETAYDELAKFDAAFSITLLRFLNDLHHGRVNPQQLDYPSPFGSKLAIDSPALLLQAIAQQKLAELPQALEPKFKQYRQLKNALASYRQTPKDANFEPLMFEKPLRPGNHYPQLAQLRQRLIALDAMPAAEAGNSAQMDSVYTEELQEAVKNFQRQNGLKPDAIIGNETAEKLNQSLNQKIRQIELAMERLRWLPDEIDGPLIIVNIPAFQLWAYQSIEDSDALNMKVIVGKAQKNQTPVLYEQMEYLEFMPYWNIPSSIMSKEILPKLYNDFGYLQSQNIELVQRGSADQDSESWDGIFDDIRRGRVRGRQRPGSKNPLGKVKFIFPNKEDVYLHDTSSPNLFNRSRRDLSHGCVRVAKPEQLAEFVLSNQPETDWDLASIQQAMSGKKTRRVTLKKPIPVLFLYATSFVDQNDEVHFYQDIYGQDAKLGQALEKNSLPAGDSMLTAKTSASG